jgi:hypothetical protein
MMKVFVLAVIGAACCSVAFAGEVKQTKAPVVKATTMSDAQMDKVTAGGAGGVPDHGDSGVGNGLALGGGIGAPSGNVSGRTFNGLGRFAQ